MAQETFTVVALPHSRSGSRPFHVSLFISPDLVPDGPEGELQDFPHWLEWAAGLASANIALFNQSGAIPFSPILDILDPAAWVAMQRWLDGFAYRIDLSAGLFLAAGLLVLGIALVTVSIQAIRAALADPVDSLRYE